jgi:DNA-binding LytR/AlgR family response regulator
MFARYLQQTMSSMQIRTQKTRAAYQQRILVKHTDKLISLKVNDVAHIYAEGRLNFIRTTDNRKFIINQSIEILYSQLDPALFFRINRSMIISFDDIKDMFAYFGGRVKIILKSQVEKDIIVSRDKVNDFKKWLGE